MNRIERAGLYCCMAYIGVKLFLDHWLIPVAIVACWVGFYLFIEPGTLRRKIP